MSKKSWMLTIPGALILSASPAWGVDLREAVQSALATNPQIRQAVSNRAATQQELEQGKGLYYPRISVEGSAGVRELRNPTRRRIGIADKTLWPIEGDLIVDQLLFDSGGRAAEVRRQAARSDAAAARVQERSEFVALNVSRTYIDYLLQQRLVAIAQDNVTFHERLAGDLREGVAKGSISIADQQQAEERLQAARARVTEAREDLDTAAITFQTLTGVPIDTVSMPPDLTQCMPATLQEAEAAARVTNPRVREAMADLATSREEIRAARAELGPKFSLEGRARAGHDIDGFEGRTTDLQALGVLRWTLYNGGTKEANVREQQERTNEVHARLFQRTREAEEDVRSAWSRLQNQTALASELEAQGRISDDLLLSYREQFNIGRRSLLDVLDAQNSRYNVQQQAETARLAKLYAQYRVLAAENRLIECLGVQAPAAAQQTEMARYHVNPIPPADLQENSIPSPALAPTAPPVGGAPPIGEPTSPTGR
ncbi:TolC family protein [Sphingomonas segetis]|jgi:adhesin transport system outer membrane protein|uniref:TolC family protein n=1 Tax=Sphingomonas segetis TaxID=1104779 RepID=UPI0012D2C730|nr:TolC family protein [Sphingomonas segetis]